MPEKLEAYQRENRSIRGETFCARWTSYSQYSVRYTTNAAERINLGGEEEGGTKGKHMKINRFIPVYSIFRRTGLFDFGVLTSIIGQLFERLFK